MGDDNKDNNGEFEDEIKRAAKVIKKSGEKNEKNQISRAFALVTQLGVQMTVCIVLGVFAGRFLDKLFGTMPVFIIIFSILGSGAAIKVIFDISKDWKD